MIPRFYIDEPLRADAPMALPAGAARHAQVLRLQPGDAITLFDGSGSEWDARITQIARSAVHVQIGPRREVERELPLHVTLALGVPANERMDALVEKATELGVAAIQPLMCERSVLRLAGERAQKKVAHWQAVAIAACEQSGRTRVPQVAPVLPLETWLPSVAPSASTRWLLSLRDASRIGASRGNVMASVIALSGPEGGLTVDEEDAARAAGFTPISLGPRVLRADTAPLALLAHLGLSALH
jgi:16S rRNA (uracil1498-N3)-methyltransferase